MSDKLHQTLNDYTVWPCPGKRMTELEWTLRYTEHPSVSDRLCAASIIAAYRELVMATGERRAKVVGQLRRAVKAKPLPQATAKPRSGS